MYENELKPCPFCGGVNARVVRYNPEGFTTECPKCASRTDFYDEPEKAADAWNKRNEVIAIKRCPFCGHWGNIREYEWDGKDTSKKEIQFFVECPHCHCVSVNCNDIEKAVDAWNTRVSVM